MVRAAGGPCGSSSGGSNVAKLLFKRFLSLAVVAAVLLAVPAVASAGLIGLDVTVTFSADTWDTYADTVTVGPGGPELSEYDGTNIGDNVMLDPDAIDINDLEIVVDFAGLGDYHSPGYWDAGYEDETAQYEFVVDWGSTTAAITGVGIDLYDVIGVSLGSEVTYTSDTVTFVVGTLGVDEMIEPEPGKVVLNLTIEEGQGPPPIIPEPTSLALLGIGLAAVRLTRRKRRSA
jgi:hypothetical protein